MKCHYAHEDGEKFWIPGCYQGIYSEPRCFCREWQKEQEKQYKENDPEFKARIENKELWKENARLTRIIERLKSQPRLKQ